MFRYNYSSAKSKCAEYSPEKSHYGSEGKKAPTPREIKNLENKQAIRKNINTCSKGSSQVQGMLEATSKSSNAFESSTVESSECHKNSEPSESKEFSWERVNSKRSKRKSKVKHKKNIVKDESMKNNRMSQEKFKCKEKFYNNDNKIQMNELSKTNEAPTENPNKENCTDSEVDSNSKDVLDNTRTVPQNQVDMDPIDAMLLEKIATATEIEWFESKYVKRCYTMNGEYLLKKFIEKYKEVKNAAKQKDGSLFVPRKEEVRGNEKRER